MQQTIFLSRNEEINYKFWGLKRSFLPLDGRRRRPTTTTTAAVTITKLNFLADRIPWKYKQRNRIYLNWNCNIQPFARKCERGMKKCVAQSLDKVSFSYFLAGRINFFNNLPSKVFGCKSSPANTWEEKRKCLKIAFELIEEWSCYGNRAIQFDSIGASFCTMKITSPFSSPCRKRKWTVKCSVKCVNASYLILLAPFYPHDETRLIERPVKCTYTNRIRFQLFHRIDILFSHVYIYFR